MPEHRTHHLDHAHEHGADDGRDPLINVAAAPEFRGGRVYKLRGLCCAEEVAVLRQTVGPLVGGSDRLAFDVLNGRMTIASEASGVAEEAIITAVAGTGMSAVRWAKDADRDEGGHYRRQQIMFTAASGAFVLIGLILHVVLAGGFAQAWQPVGAHSGQPTP